MGVLLALLPGSLPAFARKAVLAELFRATADAFERPAPRLNRLPYEERLRRYALFTREQAENALRSGGDAAALKARMYRSAYALGAKARRWLGVRSMEEVMAAGRLLYRAIEIEIEGDGRGCMAVKRCYFSRFYTAPVCGLISALDDGVFSGLSCGARLAFSERITEGAPRCRAKLLDGEQGT